MRTTKAVKDYQSELAIIAQAQVATLIDFCTIQQNIPIVDSGGSWTEHWTNVTAPVNMTNIPCYLSKHNPAPRTTVANQVLTNDRYVLDLLESTPVTIEHRVMHNGIPYSITNVFDPTSGSPIKQLLLVLF